MRTSRLGLVFLFIIPLFTILFAPQVFAQDFEANKTEEVKSVDSYDLFWPVVAGKTLGDSMYPMKSFKESFRGGLIFGKPQKMEYFVFLATKRVVEAEKLLNSGDSQNAERTLDKAMMYIQKADLIAESYGSEIAVSVNVHETNKKLANLDIFLAWAMERFPDQKTKFEDLSNLVSSLDEKI